MNKLSSRESKIAREKAARAAVPDAEAVNSSYDKISRKRLVEEIAELRRHLNAKDALDPLRRAHESDLKGAKQRVQYLLSVSPAIIYTTQASGDFGCTFVSQNLRGIMGYSPDEMTTDPKCWPGHLHPEDAPRVFEEMRPLIERGGGSVEYRFRHRDGHYIWIQDTFRVVMDAAGRPSELVGAWADITRRKSTETELSGTRQRLQYLLSVSPAIIYTTKASGDFGRTFVSDNLRTIMGYSPKEMTTDPKCWPDHLHPGDAARVIEEMAPLIERGGGTIEYRFRHRDGHYIWIQDSFRVINDDDGNPRELVGAWADITERKRAEQAALDANTQLQHTKRYLARLIERSTDFEIPQELRQLAEENVERARQLYLQFMDGVEQTMSAWSTPHSDVIMPGFNNVRERATKIAKANADAAFKLAKEVANAKDLQELLGLQSRYVQSQMQWYADQTQEFGKLMARALTSVQQEPKPRQASARAPSEAQKPSPKPR